jgi:ABC-type Fe3+-hydroxamate transport system substrate-binding protein
MRLAALASAVPDSERVPGIWLTLYGDSIYGGTTGSSYGDMLLYGGIIDMAAQSGYRDWPQFSLEELLTLDPPLVVTASGMGAPLCAHSTLSQLACCQAGGRVVEVPGKYHSDPGLGIVHAALAVQQLVHPTHATALLEPTPSQVQTAP